MDQTGRAGTQRRPRQSDVRPMSPGPLARLAAAGLVLLSATGCLRVPQQSAALSGVEADQGVTATQLQMWAYESGRRFSTLVEATADTIAARSTNPTVRLQALRWKTAAIPLFEEASLRSDPVVATVDLWVLTMQQSGYLQRGDGRDAFGPLQPLAVAVADTLELLAAELARRVRPITAEDREALRSWAERHPIQGTGLRRESVLGSSWKSLRIGETNVFGTVASLQRSLDGVSNRLGYLNEGIFKRALWQAELAARELANGTIPLLDSGRAVVFRELSAQQDQLFGAIDEQRIATISALTAERVAVLEGVRGERVAVLDAIRGERAAVLEAIRSERIATLAAIDSLTQRSIDHAGMMAGRLLLWTLIGLLFLVAVLGLGTMAAARTWRGGAVRAGDRPDLR